MLAVTPYGPQAGSARVRVYAWLARHAVSAQVHNYVGAGSAGIAILARRPGPVVRAELRLRRLARRGTDRVLLHREASPFSRGGIERRLLSSGAFSVYDLDDALQWDTAGSVLRRAFSKPAKCAAAVAHADRVIAGNDVLADWAGTLARDVVVIPSCVEPSEYLRKSSYQLHDPPRIVWMGSPSTEQYLHLVRRPLLALHRACGARLTVVSGGNAQLGPLEQMADRVRWRPDSYGAVLAGADVGIGPLEDTRYARGKCAYKLLQYGASGLPMVASPVGANEAALRLLGGTPASDPDSWYDALAHLLQSPTAARAEAGRAARLGVQEHYSFQAWDAAWRAAMELAGG
jgi:glycosyltransferase involved in cell wall biosynthesis